MKYSKEVMDLVIATINNNSVSIEHNTNNGNLMYVFQGFSFPKDQRKTGWEFESLCEFYKKKIEG
ncbi:hypothetical protein [Clostridium sp. C2-6-12]|uniref:hypothetical protein n=1 Tax=Clostridium sp. C2-6-12 TaxID=2698832 RepID=UPI00136B95CB|nr:hypothetical protein [Clostridium sp. C2-6-12]